MASSYDSASEQHTNRGAKGGNPWHDPKDGRFTSGPEEGGASAPTQSSPLAIAAVDYAKSHALDKSMGKCYTYVKRALLATGVSSHYLPGVAANSAGSALEELGYHNYLGIKGFSSPYDAPEGSIIVYDATPDATDHNRKYGHIEFRARGGFASDYYSHNARTGPASNGMTGRGRTVIGIFIRP